MKYLLILALILLPRALAALPSTDDLRAMAQDRDVGGTISAWAELTAAWHGGDLSAADLRAAMDVYETSHPDVVAMVADWRAADPESAAANTAFATQLFRGGWDMRGTNAIWQTHPEAMEQMSLAHWTGYDYAHAALEADPNFLPASDVLLNLNLTLDALSFRQVQRHLEDVMQTGGTRMSIFLAAKSLPKRWGGDGIHDIRELCDALAPLVTDVADYATDICVVDMVSWHVRYEDHLRLARNMLADLDPHPFTARARAQAAIAAQTDADAVAEYIETQADDDIFLAQDFREAFPTDGRGNDLFFMTRRNRQARALAQLQHDPYNPKSLDILKRSWPSYASILSEGEVHALQKGFLARLLLASPYNAEAWAALAHADHGKRDPSDHLRQEPYFVNSIVFSNYNPNLIGNYLQNKARRHDSVRRWIETGQLPDPGERRMEIDYYCPIQRMWRIMEFMCSSPRLSQGHCSDVAHFKQHLTTSVDVDQSYAQCPEIRIDAVENLALSPIEIDLVDLVVPLPTTLP